MLTIGNPFPDFELTAVVDDQIESAFQKVSKQEYQGKWLVVFFWPKDFTFICPTEIAAFGALNAEFEKRNAALLGASVDSEYVHLAWRHNQAELENLPFPMLSDIKHELSQSLGILDPEEGVAMRATYIIDPEGVIRFVMVNDMNVGRNPDEVLRTLDALQAGGLMPCNWQVGEKALVAE
ncbi:MAG: peroxiredoxin [Gammaproteobacteria bacterium]|nr:peroxiredoxin [Gammaproteobacteria bacterium]